MDTGDWKNVGWWIYDQGPRVWFGIPALAGGIIWSVRGFNLAPYGGTYGCIEDHFFNGWIGFIIGGSMGVFWFLTIPTYLSIKFLKKRVEVKKLSQ